ncbi:MAG: Periplasmic serine endoprotease DegP precursor [Syntrophorhabdaceae bacterium PtaU1.Bin034]|nr:MAG: Periplasmic serine endoprotease DegP precursor [Syntrophorhabdaceae bacterium PtaU1.Bin034]
MFGIAKKRARLFLIVLPLAILLVPVPLPAKEEKIADMVEVVSKAIVNIKTEELAKRGNEERSSDLLKRFFVQDEEDDVETLENIGSGVVLNPKGIIVTNEHLVSKAVTIRVKFTSREEYEANVIAADPELDIALLKVEDKKDFPFLKVTKKSVRVGEKAIVIGNPYGLSSSVTTGVVSALGRNLKISNRVYANLIQTDAAINPGSSGGALLDSNGNLLGIVTAIYEEGKGIGFAIPIEDVMSMVSEFLEHAGRRAILGIFVDKRKDDDGQYLYVSRIISGSPAEGWGLKAGDRITEVNGKRIREGMKFQNAFRKAGPDGKNQLKIIRGSETVNVSIEPNLGYVPSPLDERLCGIRVSDIEGYAKLKFRPKQKNGVVVTKVYRGGIGERYGLRAGDVIIRINNVDVLDKRSFRSLMVEGLRRNYILYQVKRYDTVFFLPIKFDTLL